MIYTGKIINEQGAVIPGASITFLNVRGDSTVQLPVVNGSWRLDTDFDGELLEDGITAKFSAPGYMDYTISASTMPGVFNVSLNKSVNKTVLLAGGVALGMALLYFAPKGKKRVGNGEKGLPPWVLPVAILGGGGYILYRLFGKPDPRIQQGGLLSDAAARELATGSAGQPSISQTEAEALSANIVQASNDCGTDEDAIYAAFDALQSRADLLLLIKTYAVRVYHACFDGDFFKDTPRNLAETLTSELSSSGIGRVNTILQSKGIDFTF